MPKADTDIEIFLVSGIGNESFGVFYYFFDKLMLKIMIYSSSQISLRIVILDEKLLH